MTTKILPLRPQKPALPGRRTLRHGLYAAAAAVVLGVGGAAPGQAAGTAGVLLLSNGNLLQGAVARAGDFYRLQRPGSELMVPAAQVIAFCRTAAEAYEVRRRHTPDDAAGHVQLARWCVQNELWDHAAGELLQARAADPTAPGLRFVERQLAAQLLPEPNQQQPVRDDAVVPVAHHSHAAFPDAKEPESETPPAATIELTPFARAQFVRSVQPMLIHSCGTAGCHQAGESVPMALDRMAIVGAGNPAAIEGNLQTVLSLLDPQGADESPLIAWARRPHGEPPREQTRLNPHQEELLIDWVRAAVGYEPAAAEYAAEAPGAAVAPADRLLADAAAPVTLDELPLEEMLLSDDEVAAYRAEMGAAAPTGSALSRQQIIADYKATWSTRGTQAGAAKRVETAAPQQRDPFDPHEFNRRMAERAAVHEASAASEDAGADAAGTVDVPVDQPGPY